MKRLVSFLLVFCLLVGTACSFSGCAENKKVLRFGYNAGFEPMSYQEGEDKLASGYFIDIMKESADRLGMAFEAVPYWWVERDWYFEKERINCFLDWDGSDEDIGYYSWSPEPMLKVKNVMLVPAALEIQSINEFGEGYHGANLISQIGDTGNIIGGYEPTISTSVDFCSCSDLDEALAMLENFRETEGYYNAQALAIDEISAEYIMNKYPGKYRVLPEAVSEASYSVGFARADDELRPKLCAALDEMKADGTIAKISEHWFGRDITKDF